MMHGTAAEEGSRLVAEAPTGWTATDPDDGFNDVVLLGPRDLEGVRPRVEVRREPAYGSSVDADCLEMVAQLRRERPDASVVSYDTWPHPELGEGRVIQTAFLVDQSAVAHDRYLFHTGTQQVVVSLDCLLQDLVRLEEAVAAIVASLRWVDRTRSSGAGPARGEELT